MLCSMVELGRININIEFSMLVSHLQLPREEHLESVLNIVSYIQGKHNYRLSLYPTYPEIDYSSFKNHKWVDFYRNVKEAITTNMPNPMGKDIDFDNVCGYRPCWRQVNAKIKDEVPYLHE